MARTLLTGGFAGTTQGHTEEIDATTCGYGAPYDAFPADMLMCPYKSGTSGSLTGMDTSPDAVGATAQGPGGRFHGGYPGGPA